MTPEEPAVDVVQCMRCDVIYQLFTTSELRCPGCRSTYMRTPPRS